ncbi:ABC transporter ATP-binding protein [Bosea sp. (in: a-proteobacteria)]|uniref:ABC transporter ATP-binding protein n=1 Tax=Bosea sp. (in: a-proteobacteria) TaxID=1871050 RepID=UPI0026048383|nr:ABC transporter ATP-binding protein [Bosea sp. (in: a-proteobacteria)]MCO5091317.1 ABC transporter ATP-binding protein [Bosea sp. (in: a-proteobacteria)]
MTDMLARPPATLGAGVRIRGLSLKYGGFKAVDDVSLDIAPGEFVTMLGPSGSGKTTTMMSIAGFIRDYEGSISIGGEPVDALPPHRRNIGVVFQHLALFPHMTVADNIAFPLLMRGMPKAEIADRVRQALDLVRLSPMGGRLPSQLSGGQQQRVAIARALVFSPPLLLLDEPLGALDRKLRDALQLELKELHRKLGITIVLVTHDQVEAIILSDRVAVMNAGRIAQIATPTDLYFSPANRFVADFVGESACFPGTIRAVDGARCVVEAMGGLRFHARHLHGPKTGDAIEVMLRPEHVRIAPEPDAENAVEGTIIDSIFLGEHTRIRVALPGGGTIAAVVDNRSAPRERGESVRLGWAASDALVLPPDQ